MTATTEHEVNEAHDHVHAADCEHAAAEHEAVARALDANDADAAASAMAVHMVTAGERLADSAR